MSPKESKKPPVLDVEQVRAYYDRFGGAQDTQGFYEDPPLRALVDHADFEHAHAVFEFGCGTGKLAAQLLGERLPGSATYTGCDVSSTMVDLATRRLAPYADRATVTRTDGEIRFSAADGSVDRVVSAYVLDLLSAEDERRFLGEARRVLGPGGKLCLVSLTHGVTVPSRIVSSLWSGVFRLRASLVGGCRPIRLQPLLEADAWKLQYRTVLTPYGVPSEVVVATR